MKKSILTKLMICMISLFILSGVALAYSNGSVTNNYVGAAFIDMQMSSDTAYFQVVSGYQFQYTNKLIYQSSQIVFSYIDNDPFAVISDYIYDIDVVMHRLSINGTYYDLPNYDMSLTSFSGNSAVLTRDITLEPNLNNGILVSSASGHTIGADFDVTGVFGITFTHVASSTRSLTFN